ncbi:DNA cytosine methyltransferase [Maribacter stanieri]|uniref:DNA cytosine methyltransferase n=1 Tax=Maribacter stanieri TaxID=440514 RepID=UPI0030D73D7B
MQVKNKTKIKAVDFFCGGGGMSFGMQKSGIQVLAGIDYEENCRATYNANIGKDKFIKADVFELKEEELEETLKLKRNDDDLLLIGCSPCQFWSIINTDKNKSQKSKSLLVEFERFVKYFNPGYVVVENVPGVLRKKGESGLEDFINWLKNKGYKVHCEIHNVSEYGVPQSRKRLTLIANRVTNLELQPIKFEGKKLTVYDVIGEHNGFSKIDAGHKDKSDFMHTVAGLKQINIDRLKLTKKDGGSRMSYANNEDLVPQCHKNDTTNFKDTYGRIWWHRQSPTITTKFFSISNGRFAHPEENRALSIREGATLQSFPKDYKFIGTSMGSLARLIGNAVPPEYSKRVGQAIIQNHFNG